MSSPAVFTKHIINGRTNFKSEVLFLVDSKYFPGIENFSSILTPVYHLIIFEANIISPNSKCHLEIDHLFFIGSFVHLMSKEINKCSLGNSRLGYSLY